MFGLVIEALLLGFIGNSLHGLSTKKIAGVILPLRSQ